MIKYILLIIAGLVIDLIETVNDSNNIFGNNLGIGFLITMIGMYCLFVCVWFKILRLFYPKAKLRRLWGITGYIIWIVTVVILCFSGIGAVSLITIKHPIRGLVPRPEDK